jgi:hypothetical protein
VIARAPLSAAAVEAEILAFLRAELPIESAGESPIENWYRVHYLQRGDGFAPYGYATAGMLERRRERFDRVTEIGAGIGANCLQFALRGWPTIAVEHADLQFGLMERLLDRLRGIDPTLAGRVQPLKYPYPEHAAEYLDEQTLVCFFGPLCPLDDEIERRMLEALQLAGGAILDPRVFFRLRQSPQEQEDLVAAIESLGFAAPVLLWDSSYLRGFNRLRLIYFERITTATPEPLG